MTKMLIFCDVEGFKPSFKMNIFKTKSLLHSKLFLLDFLQGLEL